MKLKAKIKPIPQTPLTRACAAVIGIAILIGIFSMVFQYTGNPIFALYAQHKIVSYFEKEHAGEGYVVGPVDYTFSNADNKHHYICRVYNSNEIDTGFSAYYDHGQVLTSKLSETDSGNNTYKRFKLLLGKDIDVKQLHHSMKEYGLSYFYVDFYPGSNNNVFNNVNPVFIPNSEYDPNHLPLPSVFYAVFDYGQKPANTLEDAAAYLVALKNAVEEQGLHFDYYSADLYNTAQWSLLDVPTDKIPSTTEDTEDNTAFADLVEYLNQRLLESSAQPKADEYSVPNTRPVNSAQTLLEQKENLIYHFYTPLT